MVYMSDQNSFWNLNKLDGREQWHSSFSPRKRLLSLVLVYTCPNLSQRQEFGLSFVFWVAGGSNRMVFTLGTVLALKLIHALASNSNAGCQGWQKRLVGCVWDPYFHFLYTFFTSCPSHFLFCNLGHREEGSDKQFFSKMTTMYVTPPQNILILK